MSVFASAYRVRLRFSFPFFARRVGAWLKAWPLLFLFLAGTPASAAPGWQQVTGEGFVLLTPDSPKEAVAAAQEFQEFINAVADVVPVDKTRLPPLSLVLMRGERAFRPYRPVDASGKPREVAGFFLNEDSWAVAVMSGRWSWTQGKRVMQHEGVHWLLSAFDGERPRWIEEGLAETFSTYVRTQDGPTLGEPIREHLRRRRLPMATLVRIRPEHSLWDEDGLVGSFYASSWLFVHYLLFGEHSLPRDSLDRYMTAMQGATTPADAFREAFGGDYAHIDAALTAYIRRGKFSSYVMPVKPIRLTAAPASALTVETALARVALAAGNFAQAEKHLEQVRQLVPADSPLPHELAGHIAYRRDDLEAMKGAFARAAELGSRDAGVFLKPALRTLRRKDGGELALLGPGAGTFSQTDLHEVARLYRRVIELQPGRLVGYVGLASVIPLIELKEPSDRALLERGVAQFPHALLPHAALAVLDFDDERYDQAIDRLQAVAGRAEARQEKALADLARELLFDWRFVLGVRAIRAATEEKNLALFREVVAELEASGVPAPRRQEFARIKRDLERLEKEAAAAAR